MMSDLKDAGGELFDEWPDTYDKWFDTPIGSLVKKYYSRLTEIIRIYISD